MKKSQISLLILTCSFLVSSCTVYMEEKNCRPSYFSEGQEICTTEKETSWPLTIILYILIGWGIQGFIADRNKRINSKAENVVDFFQKVSSDESLRQQIISEVSNISNLLTIAEQNGYPFTVDQLSFMGKSFVQELDALKRFSQAIEIIGKDNFSHEEIERIERDLGTIEYSVSIISKLISLEPKLPKREIVFPKDLTEKLSQSQRNSLISLGIKLDS